MEQEKDRICYEKRHRLTHLIVNGGFTPHEAAELVTCMIGKSEEEKEQWAEELTEKILSGEILPTRDKQKERDDRK